MTNANPYTVGITKTCEVLGRFPTEQLASEFIDTLDNYEDGRYYLDGPEEVTADYQSPQGFTGKRMGTPGEGAYSGLARGNGPQGQGQ